MDTIKIWGFVGSSGTGKSHRALSVAKEYGISAIIDDGLLIKENLILAGMSAKREQSKLASVRRALFFDSEHSQAVRNAIKEASDIDSILILGTSEHMVDSIVDKIGLPKISEYIYIDDVASDSEIDEALKVRKSQGKHVIPAPTFALKKEFSGYFIDPLRRIVRWGRDKKLVEEEKTVVRPTFSYMGSYTISRAAIEQMICILTLSSKYMKRVIDVKVDILDGRLSVELQLAVEYGCAIHIALEELLDSIRAEVERQTAINVDSIKLTAKTLII
ncbi:MAG: hypothetical protein FWH55_07250 [Oscillospiraceae bacterium]|nr:hypothetical protein [Oscillospiraceae bacterium]